MDENPNEFSKQLVGRMNFVVPKDIAEVMYVRVPGDAMDGPRAYPGYTLLGVAMAEVMQRHDEHVPAANGYGSANITKYTKVCVPVLILGKKRDDVLQAAMASAEGYRKMSVEEFNARSAVQGEVVKLKAENEKLRTSLGNEQGVSQEQRSRIERQESGLSAANQKLNLLKSHIGKAQYEEIVGKK